MKKLTFKFDAESSLEVLFVNFQWWFNAQKLASLTKDVKLCQEQLKLCQEQLKFPHKSCSNGTDYLTRLKEQQRFNSQIIDNFIQSIENQSLPLIIFYYSVF